MLGELQKRKLIKLFSMYDTCNIGTLKFSDFEKIVETLAEVKGWKSNSTEYTQLLNKFTNRWVHLKGNIQDRVGGHAMYKVQLKDWLNYHEFMLDDVAKYEDEIHTLADMIFDVCDVDDSGHLDQNEWVALFRAFNLPVVYAGDAFVSLDQDRDNLLQKEEVLSALRDFYYSDDAGTPANFMFGPY
ncbi:MAG: EF-hand domain-containing protein [Cyanobacteria bacterium P01_A01_bin.123]